MSLKGLFFKEEEKVVKKESGFAAMGRGETYMNPNVAPPIISDMSAEFAEQDTSAVISIEDLYNLHNLQKDINDGNTIFKVKEFADTLPKTLTAEIKKESVLAILKTSKIDLEVLLEDGYRRINKLSSTQVALTQKSADNIAENLAKIKEAEDLIESLKQENIDLQKTDEDQTKLIKDEIKSVEAIITFVGDATYNKEGDVK